MQKLEKDSCETNHCERTSMEKKCKFHFDSVQFEKMNFFRFSSRTARTTQRREKRENEQLRLAACTDVLELP